MEKIYITRGLAKGDHGLDVVSTFQVDGVKTVFGMQCKKYSPQNKIEGYQVRELKGALSGATQRQWQRDNIELRRLTPVLTVDNLDVSGKHIVMAAAHPPMEGLNHAVGRR